MKTVQRFSSSFLLGIAASMVVTSVCSAPVAFAQESQPFGNRPADIDLSNTYQPPRVYVESVNVTEKSGQTMKGSLHLFNSEDAMISDLSYRIEIYQAASVDTDARVLYGYIDGKNLEPMLAKEERDVSFNVTVPNLPKGDFALRFQLVQANGRQLGWSTVAWTSDTNTDHVDAMAIGIKLPEFNNQIVEPLTGPNVSPSSSFALEATVMNPSDHEMTVKPMLHVYPFDVSRGESDIISFDAITLAPHEQRDLNLEINAVQTAGVSIGHLTFEDQNGTSISPISIFRWVVRGASADVVAVKIQSVGTQKGQTTDVQVDYVGPADAETHLTGSILVTVNDAQGLAGGVKVTDATLTDALSSVTVHIAMNRATYGQAAITTSIMGPDGTVLATSTANLPYTPASIISSIGAGISAIGEQALPVALIALFIALLALGIRSILGSERRMNAAKTFAAKVLAISMLMMQGASLTAPVYAQSTIPLFDPSMPDDGNYPQSSGQAFAQQGASQGIQVVSAAYADTAGLPIHKPVIELFINKPIHDAPAGTYQCNGTIPFEYRLSYAVCYNVPSVVRVIGRVDVHGGKLTNLVGTSQSNWQKVYDEQLHRNNTSDLNCQESWHQWCFRQDSVNTSINLSNLNIQAENVTLQIAAKRQYDENAYGIPTDEISSNDPYISGGSAVVTNIWLNCQVQPQCGNGKMEQGEQCDDGNRNNSDACNNQCKLTTCGDGAVQNPNGNGQQEQCDDGNQNNNDSCTNQCTIPVVNTDVTIAKIVDEPIVPKGGAAVFRIQGQNIGQTNAQNVVITDTVPSQLTIVSAPGCSISGQTVRCTVGTLTPGQKSNTFIVTTTVRNDSSVSEGMVIVNPAHIATDTQETNYQNNDDTAEVTVPTSPKSDVQVQKSGPTQVNQGQTINYSIIAKNNGPATADNVVVTDAIPSGLTYIDNQSDSRCNQNGNNVVCQLGSMVNQQQLSLNLAFQTSVQTSCGPVTNTAIIATTTPETTLSNNQSSFQTQIICSTPKADVTIVKSANTPSAQKGDRVTFTLRITNNGPDTAENVTVNDPVVANLENASVVSGPCNISSGNLSCNLGTLNAGASVNVQIGYTVGQSAVCGGTVTNTAMVTTSTAETNVNNNQSSASMAVTCPSGCIDIQKEAYDPFGNRISVVPQFQFRLDGNQTIVNDSNGRATFNNVTAGTHTISEVVPSGWSQFNVTPANGTVTVTGGNSCAQVTFKNQQNSVSSSSSSSSSSSNGAGCIEILKEAFDTYGQKLNTVPQFQFRLDGNQTIVNDSNGRATFNNVTAGTHTISEVVPNGWNQFLVTPTNGTVNVVSGGACAGVVFKNQQTSSSSSSSSSSSGSPDLTIQKSGPSTVQQNSQMIYTITVTNNGNASAQNVEIRDVIPSGMTYISSNGSCSLNSTTLSCQLGTMNAGESRTVSITVLVNASVACNAVLINIATVSTTSGESNTSNNTSNQVQTTVQCVVNQTGCIEVTKQAYDSDGNQIYSVPSFNFTLDGNRTASNDSNGRARFDNVSVGTHTVIESVRSGWNLDSVSPSNGTVTVNSGGSCAQVQFRNRETDNGDEDFSISKTDGETEVEQGGSLTYTIRVRNNSNHTVNNVTVTDTLPDDVEFQSCTRGCDDNGRFLTWRNQTFSANEERIYEVDVDVDDNANGTLVNEARVFNKRATDRTDVIEDNNRNGRFDAQLTKTASVAEVFPGGVVEYTLTLRNTGNEDLQNVTVTDTLPPEMIVVDDGNADTHNGNNLTWDVGDLNNGDSWTVTYRTTVSTSAFPGQILSNRACAEDDDNKFNECKTVTVAVIGNLPQTGIMGDIMGSTIKLRPIRIGGSPASSSSAPFAPLAAWISIAGMGLGLGMGAGRKLLIGF